jgi:selenophosphate synthetase-related protein
MEDAESAVLDAARKWVAAKEAILAADEAREGDRITTESALDQAEYELTDTVYRLLGREPRLPHRG